MEREDPVVEALRGRKDTRLAHERMMLMGADRDAFLAAVMDPPEPTEKLAAALKQHRNSHRARHAPLP